MAEFTVSEKSVNRRGFLRGSALFAAAVGLSVAAPALAQEQGQKTPTPEEEKPKQPSGEQTKKEEPPKSGGGSGAAKEDPNKLVDASGREYRICERCGGNMYKEGNTWTCEQCGFSYTE
jgi:hypothetical protein